MPFRLLRSRAFWGGVPGLVFLLWAWDDSRRTHSEGYLEIVPLLVWHRDNAVIVHLLPGYRGPRAGSRMHFDREDFAAMRPLRFPKPEVYIEQTVFEPRLWVIWLPHWLLVFLYALPWSALILWRRQKRLEFENRKLSPR